MRLFNVSLHVTIGGISVKERANRNGKMYEIVFDQI